MHSATGQWHTVLLAQWPRETVMSMWPLVQMNFSDSSITVTLFNVNQAGSQDLFSISLSLSLVRQDLENHPQTFQRREKFAVQPLTGKTEAVATKLDCAIKPSRCQQQILPKQPPQKIDFLTVHLCAQYVPVCRIFAKLLRQSTPASNSNLPGRAARIHF